MANLTLNMEITGNKFEALNTAIKIAKLLCEPQYIKCEGFILTVYQDSNINELLHIHQLQIKVRDLNDLVKSQAEELSKLKS